MSIANISSAASVMRAKLAGFLSRHLDNPALGWPQLMPRMKNCSPTREPDSVCQGMKVLIVGDVALRADIRINASRRKFQKLMATEDVPRGCGLELVNVGIGGFVGRIVPVAAALGADMRVCTSLPEPILAWANAFLKSYHADSTDIPSSADPFSLEIRVQCSDGITTVLYADSRETPRAARPLGIPDADVILFDASSPGVDTTSFAGITEPNAAASNRPTIGQRITRQIARIEIQLHCASRLWSFLSGFEMLKANATRKGEIRTEPGNTSLPSELADLPGRVVVHLGKRGAVLLSGGSCPYFVHSCPLAGEPVYGAGDVLLTVTTISAGTGAGDRTSLRRGVAAASGYVAGLPFPSRLEELDVDP